MARLVDDLLSLSRIEQNQHVRPETPVDLVLIARHVADTLAPLAREMEVELMLDVEARVIVIGERDELVRVGAQLERRAVGLGAGVRRQLARQPRDDRVRTRGEREAGGQFPGGFNAAMWDGTVRFVSDTVTDKTLQLALNPSDGQVLGPDWGP